MEKLDILSFEKQDIEAYLVEIGERKFRGGQIYDWLHTKKVTDFSQMTNISVQLQEHLSKFFCIKNLNIEKKLVSHLDDTIKYLYRLSDGEAVESVLMKHHHGESLCISTQVGCKMGCSFCASTKGGLVRNLTPSEMLSQLYQTEKESGRTVNSIVLMGIGEPLDNFDNVVKFLKILQSGHGMSLRNVSLSTCGLVDRIIQLADMKLGVTLSVSLHATNDKTRSEIMPINRKYNIKTLLDACKYYFKQTGRRISFEFALIEGVNDTKETARELISLLRNMLCHVNLIPINPIKERDYKRSRYANKFQEILTQAGINATIRRTLGADIDAACGQLRATAKQKNVTTDINEG